MTTLPLDATLAAPPRLLHVPEYASSAGAEAVELAAMAGLVLDPWQQFVLAESLGERPDGRWAAFEVGLVLPRQNGKDAILEARELTGLFLIGERLLIHSAHQFDTSLEHFRRLLFLIESTPDFDRRVRRVSRSHGEEGIELKGGQRIRFRTRTKGGGRGFSGDCLILNEAMILPESSVGALLPTLSARPNPQVWYAGSAVDQEVHEDGLVLSRLRARAEAADGDERLAYFEWSLAAGSPDELDDETVCDPSAWAEANPGLGIRISAEHVDLERRTMAARTFAVERLGVGDWPDPSGEAPSVLDLEKWSVMTAAPGSVGEQISLAFDIPPERSSATIAAAWFRPDGPLHIEIVERRPGTEWLPGRLAELIEKHEPLGVVYDSRGPAASLVPDLVAAGVGSRPVTTAEHVDACGLLFDKVEQLGLRHLGQPELNAAVKGAAKRPLGDAWAWSRKTSAVDISPLVACTLALWAVARLWTGGGFDWGDDNDEFPDEED